MIVYKRIEELRTFRVKFGHYKITKSNFISNKPYTYTVDSKRVSKAALAEARRKALIEIMRIIDAPSQVHVSM